MKWREGRYSILSYRYSITFDCQSFRQPSQASLPVSIMHEQEFLSSSILNNISRINVVNTRYCLLACLLVTIITCSSTYVYLCISILMYVFVYLCNILEFVFEVEEGHSLRKKRLKGYREICILFHTMLILFSKFQNFFLRRLLKKEENRQIFVQLFCLFRRKLSAQIGFLYSKKFIEIKCLRGNVSLACTK